MNSKIFKSKVGGGVAMSFAAGAAVQVAILVALAVAAPQALIVVLPLLLLAAVFIGWLYRSTRYIVMEDHLLVRSGWVSIDIPLAQIAKIEPSRNPISAPAWSTDRLLVTYGREKSCLISPKGREQFLGLLRERGVRVA